MTARAETSGRKRIPHRGTTTRFPNADNQNRSATRATPTHKRTARTLARAGDQQPSEGNPASHGRGGRPGAADVGPHVSCRVYDVDSRTIAACSHDIGSRVTALTEVIAARQKSIGL